ncbi:hypothetical protein BDP27DRAFT_1233307, partial [Rhodocollybia butyracea]
VEVLHPKYWKTYFQRAEWEDDWIDSAVSAARRTWHKYYRPLIKHQTSGMHSAGEDSVDEFGELDAPATSVDHDPFEDFINGAVSEEEAIDHWSHLLAGTDCDSFTPIQALSCMALDFLSAPAMSTDVKHLLLMVVWWSQSSVINLQLTTSDKVQYLGTGFMLVLYLKRHFVAK